MVKPKEKYMLDANTLMTAARLFYAYDIIPLFWKNCPPDVVVLPPLLVFELLELLVLFPDELLFPPVEEPLVVVFSPLVTYDEKGFAFPG